MGMNKYYKEKEYIEELLKKNKLDTGIRGDLKTLAKYYKHLGQDKDAIEKSLYEFCEKKCKGWFNKVRHYKMIDNAITYALKDDSVLIQIESIEVTKKEMEFIESLKYEELEKKIIFSLLIINKLNNARAKMRGIDSKNNYFGGSGEYSYKSLMDTLNEKLTRTYREKGIHRTIKQFNDDGLTRTTNRLSLELLFLNQIEEDEETIFEVNDFDNIGLAYEYYYGSKKVKKCIECGNLIRNTNYKNQYCNSCKIIKIKEKHVRYNNKRK
ncbi:hypothetical protein FJQ98_16625 [Lysinibacillus agricola]|uniref:Uncharacterized protein n=1 Tax=Lysinibacillus agricola TaxID=2590012 RepID=A0ABX7AM48_9BACI|nr:MULTISPECIES: hypothetical protein [Lysinibacillus]KOS61448.1 hypothetical protein AN161_17810 [Lysinibacillus sp. FJAT-14222]QQP10870.1 hypothetical protein FJQ98_16625 [Lysinibacillus agricola]